MLLELHSRFTRYYRQPGRWRHTTAPNVVRHDDDDPYLVVAADKGTATFSDLANDVAAEYGFWLRDAFASGGSTGYDHKKMGITARGAWEAVKRHFRELGLDIQTQPFTVVGIGDMSGDVFGNGMLLSRHIRLVAAFDHRHIFIDPDPDAAKSFAERERLFQLPRSTWEDYDRSALSAGGGIYSRTAKVIKLSPQARQALGVEQESFSPSALIQAILKAPVDLLWNGGIGTYVKASTESNTEVGDKTNDSLRVNGGDLRCRVVGEGGNLGVTQLGRIEYAERGGHINTDAIDNAGGVDCSDHEVNIKILLNGIVAEGDLTTKQRNQLLSDMTDEVAQLVLHDNYRQTQALSLCQLRGSDLLDEQSRFMRQLEKEGQLARALEQLPDDEALNERIAGRLGLSRPELAVLLSYAKITSYGELLDDALVREPCLEGILLEYFPQPLRERYTDQILGHRLRAEITATVVTNQILNRMGATFFFRLRERLGASVAASTRAYLAAQEIFGLNDLWEQVEALDNRISSIVQMQLLLKLCQLHERATQWLLRNQPGPLPVDKTVANIRPALNRLRGIMSEILPEAENKALKRQINRLSETGVPPTLAETVAGLEALYPALDIVKIATDRATSLERAGGVYFAVVTELQLNWLRDRISDYEPSNSWQERARVGLEEELYGQLRLLTSDILAASDKQEEPEAQAARWVEQNQSLRDRLLQTLSDCRSTSSVDLAMLTVAIQELTALAQTGAARPLIARKRQERTQAPS
nr:NAD-glutamate dehydrogenase domain-containing protein [Alkalilimnicola ehrlichii]